MPPWKLADHLEGDPYPLISAGILRAKNEQKFELLRVSV